MCKTDKKQDILLFLYHATKCPTEAEKTEYTVCKRVNYWLQKTKQNQIPQNFLVLKRLTFEKTTEIKSVELM